MINAEFVSAITSLAVNSKETEVIEIDGNRYTQKSLIPVKEPEPIPINVETLTAIKDYLERNPDILKLKETIVLVDSCFNVMVLSRLYGGFQQRYCFMRASNKRILELGTFMSVEAFIIRLQANFIQDETTETILKVVGNITDGMVTTYADDGVGQQVTAKAGVARVANIPVPNPVLLRPYRTFSEVEQPVSRFVFRMRSGDQSPTCALFEADGGAWKNEAVVKIKEWLVENLPKEITILA